MDILPLDRSIYLKGLLLLAGRDSQITDGERQIIRETGKLLGFSSGFVQEAVNNFFQNEYIEKNIPVFSDARIARAFIADGIKIAYSNNEIHPEEADFLKKTAEVNGLGTVDFSELDSYRADNRKRELAIGKLLGEDLINYKFEFGSAYTV